MLDGDTSPGSSRHGFSIEMTFPRLARILDEHSLNLQAGRVVKENSAERVLTQAALRLVAHAHKSYIISGVYHEAHVADGVLGHRLLQQSCAPHQVVRDPNLHEGRLQRLVRDAPAGRFSAMRTSKEFLVAAIARFPRQRFAFQCMPV